MGVAAAVGVLAASSVGASLGPFEHGNGIKAQGAGGVSYVAAEETTALSANPSQALGLGGRYDIGIDVMSFYGRTRVEGNALGPDETYKADGEMFYPTPQAGFVTQLNSRWAAGVTVLLAGLGPDFPESPYQRFGGSREASLTLGSISAAPVLAYKLSESHWLGFGAVVGYQTFEAKGLQFLSSTDPQFTVSASPAHTTNQGVDGSLSAGYVLGWTGRFGPRTSVGAGYRSKSWTQKHKEYRGLLPDGGSLELPAVYGAGVAHDLTATLRIALEWQQFRYAAEKAFANRLANLQDGNLLGSPNGPGFGVKNQNAYKLGLSWSVNPELRLRAGYIHATQPVRESETLFIPMAPIVPTTHYTTGFTLARGDWEITGMTSYYATQTVRGKASIPSAFGGGEIIETNEGYGIGISCARRFGG